MKHLKPAEKVLQSLGITEPNEIDLEAIAWTLGASIKYKSLTGCEARIIGIADKAIITVNCNSTSRRQRFSIGHELGHWEFDRGQLLVCRANEFDSMKIKSPQREKRADQYAADLIMPNYLFYSMMKSFSKMSLTTISKLSDAFDASLTASAIRVIESGEYPAILICHGLNGRKWFSRSPLVPARWFPRAKLQPDSSAFDITFGKRTNDTRLHIVSADAWFDCYSAHKFEIYEQTFRIGPNEALTLLMIEDDEMLEE